MLANASFHSLGALGLVSNDKGIEGEPGCGSFSLQDDLYFASCFILKFKKKKDASCLTQMQEAMKPQRERSGRQKVNFGQLSD